jgi:hypothetical protein
MSEMAVAPGFEGTAGVRRAGRLRAWRFVTLLLSALAIALPFAHLLEMPAKRTFAPELYRVINQNLYWAFGTFGAAIEVATVLACIALAFLVRGRRPAYALTLAAAVLVVTAHVVFWVLIAPVNAEIAAWAPASVPAGWPGLRDRWEFSHAIRALLFLSAFGSLLASILVETPLRWVPREAFSVDDEDSIRIALRPDTRELPRTAPD